MSTLNIDGIIYPYPDHLLTPGDINFLANDPTGGVPDKWRAIYRKFITPGDTVLDIGAYIGTLSVNFALLGARVRAFEGSPSNYSRLREIVEKLPQVIVIPIALSDQTNRCVTRFNDCTEHKEQLIDYLKYDDLLPDSISFVKMDIEGMETVALKGMTNLMSGLQRPVFQIEYHPDMPHKYDGYPGFVKPEDGGFDLQKEFTARDFLIYDEDLNPAEFDKHDNYFVIPSELTYLITA